VNAAARLEELHRSILEIEEVTVSLEEERPLDEQALQISPHNWLKRDSVADSLATSLIELNHRAAATRDSRAALEVRQAEATARSGFVRESCMGRTDQPLEELAPRAYGDGRV